jgi:hypothetical protein
MRIPDGWEIVEWKVKVEAATWLDTAGLSQQATRLRDLEVVASSKYEVTDVLEQVIQSHEPHLDCLALKRPTSGIDHCAHTGMYFCMVHTQNTDSHPICLLVNWIVPGCQQIIQDHNTIEKTENILVDSLRQFGFSR